MKLGADNVLAKPVGAADIVQALDDEYGHEAQALQDVSDVFTKVDEMLTGELKSRQG